MIGAQLARVGDAGASNDAAYLSKSKQKLSEYPRLLGFAEMLEGTQPGTNVDASKVLHFDKAESVLHARGLAIAAAGGDESAGLAEFAARRYTPRREAFEDLWDNGQRFVCCSPNPGTLGASKYGAYCLVIDPATLVLADTGVFPWDTLQNYTDENALVDADRACGDVGSWQARAAVAVNHLGDRAEPLSEAERADLVCGADDYMEVVTVGPLAVDQVMILRVDAETWEEHSDLWWDWKEGRLSDPTDRAKAMVFDALSGWTNLEIVEVNGA